MLSRHSFGHQGIEDAHEQSASNADPDSAQTDRMLLALSASICERVNNNRQHHERHAPEEQSGMALGGDRIVQKNTLYQCQPDSNRKGHGQPGNVNGRDQKQMSYVEDSRT